MNLSSYILEQALRRLQLPEGSIRQFQLAEQLSNVEGKGFPKELFQLSAPIIVRGLLNFAVLQMLREWNFPYWVHKQLNPRSESYAARSQNPLLINTTHRNWTAVGTPNGFHEAIVDPRGLATPLPREWSVDTWLVVEKEIFFPSLCDAVEQDFASKLPCVSTRFSVDGIDLSLEHFAAGTNHGFDVLFSKTTVRNSTTEKKSGAICVAVRPFNPEGVAPIFSLDFKSSRIVSVNNVTGVVFAETPDRVFCSSRDTGDLSYALKQRALDPAQNPSTTTSRCPHGLAHSVAVFRYSLAPGEMFPIHYSIALADETQLRRRRTKQTWRVSYEKRKSEQQTRWEKELGGGAKFEFADPTLQTLYDSCILTLLQFNDDGFISPGPFLYHHFWYRDAVVMLRALDVLGFHKRVRNVIDAFPDRLTVDGFFRGPDGEWDSNGAVLWSIQQHFRLTSQHLWLKNWYPNIKRAAQWIVRKRKQSPNGLMPPSLSAEHLGTVDQYYWDTFWSLAGLRAMAEIAGTLGQKADAHFFDKEAHEFNQDILDTFKSVSQRLGEEVIPATPFRNFDESAIGSISSIYPLALFGNELRHPTNTVKKLRENFVDEKGFFHPFVHSGYNPYLTLQIAHSFLNLGEIAKAWEVAETVFRQAHPPYSLPEAIHPRTGGGTMGDGHHGWAAAEIILFLRDCLVKEEEGKLSLFKGSNKRLVQKGRDTTLKNVPTTFGPFSCSLSFTAEDSATLNFVGNFRDEPSTIDIFLPFEVKQVVSSSPNYASAETSADSTTILRCSPIVRTLFLKL
jgi:hypothetical protein